MSLDNDITLLYSASAELNTPTQLVLPYQEEDKILFKTLYQSLDEFLLNKPSQITEQLYFDFSKYVDEIYSNITEKNKVFVFYKKFYETSEINKEVVSNLVRQIIFKISDPEKYYKVNQLQINEQYRSWLNEIEKAKEIDQIKNRNYVSSKNTLLGYENNAVQMTKPNYTKVFYSAKVVESNSQELIDPENGIFIFNESLATEQIPYIQYNDSYGRRYYKTFYSDQIKLNYTKIIPQNLPLEKNIIFLVINQSRFGNDNYTYGIYDLITGRIGITTLVDEFSLEEMNNFVQTTLRGTNLVDVRERRLSGDFDITGINENNFDEPTFLDLIMNDPITSIYLYIEEIDISYPLKKRLYIHYRSLQQPESEAETKTPSSVSIMLTPQEKGIKVNITKTISDKIMKEFQFVFSLLLARYLDLRQSISDDYKYYIPDYLNVGSSEEIPTSKLVGTIAQELQEKSAEIFVKNYGTKCMNRPEIVTPEEYEQNKDSTFIFEGVEYKRQFLTFPKDTDEFIFECRNPEYPFVGVFKNTLSNKKKFEYLPCCFDKNQMDPNIKSGYNDYYRQRSRTSRRASKAISIMKVDKILTGEDKAYLPVSLNNFLTTFFGVSKIYSRDAVDDDRFNVFHAINIALNKESYFDDPIGTVQRQYRKYLETPYEILKQELYDLNEIQIKKELQNEFINTQIVYRALEELFNINLYVFTKSKSAKDPTFEIPRNAYGCLRPVNTKKKTVVLYKHFGAESERRKLPHYELISKDDDFLFADPATINTAFYTVQGLQIISSKGVETIRNNLINLYDYLQSKGVSKISKQYLDQYGKLRGVVVQFRGSEFFIGTPPMQPLNIKIIEPNPYNPNDDFRLLTTTKDFIRLFNEITGFSVYEKYDSKAKINALWFEDFYCLVDEEIEWSDDYQIQPFPLLPNQELINRPERVFLMRRLVNYMVQFTYWFYFNSGMKSITKFVKKYFSSVEGFEGDSLDFYVMPEETYFLPQDLDTNGCLRWLEGVMSTFCRDGQLIFYSEEYADEMVKMLRKMDNDNTLRKSPIRILGMFERASDFNQLPNTYIFMSKEQLDDWIDSIDSNIGNIQVQKSIPQKAETFDPIVFEYSGQDYFLQRAESMNQAKAIALRWMNERINEGKYQDSKIGEEIDESRIVLATLVNGNFDYISYPEGGDLMVYEYPILEDGVKQYGAILAV